MTLDPTLLRARATVLRALRGWFDAHGYLEVPTPARVVCGALEEHLETVDAAGRPLRTSPELALKRAVAAGLGRVYEIGPCFRAEEDGVHHSLEFTMLEWYRVGAGTAELMDEVESLVAAAARALGQSAPVFTRRRVDALLADPGPAAADAWFHAWVDAVEPTLTEPTIVWGYPAWQAALARVRDGRADRFEVYLGGIELANAFAEEPCAAELLDRQHAANARRAAAGRPPHPVDPAFYDALPAMPRCAGIALGVDRLVLALTGAPHIRAVQVR